MHLERGRASRAFRGHRTHFQRSDRVRSPSGRLPYTAIPFAVASSARDAPDWLCRIRRELCYHGITTYSSAQEAAPSLSCRNDLLSPQERLRPASSLLHVTQVVSFPAGDRGAGLRYTICRGGPPHLRNAVPKQLFEPCRSCSVHCARQEPAREQQRVSPRRQEHLRAWVKEIPEP